jgi:hypothetical protein
MKKEEHMLPNSGNIWNSVQASTAVTESLLDTLPHISKRIHFNEELLKDFSHKQWSLRCAASDDTMRPKVGSILTVSYDAVCTTQTHV